ncbi:hypothetical protein BE04_30790 [Sorangium cellulosum]|uniref:Uncharacterized protein n=2 Tax=Sorangium cellulosum TaxID=56 RepID=A0A150NYD8_SORCE|nr:hypothetical protein [Sorangium cellulosum]AGP41657.1 hypothetical protein SCE1572_48525 [Sorangium cellulosum So0157-2]KYF46839.1 hypothetical protein BE04_30790 [Sorangium cellulosum]
MSGFEEGLSEVDIPRSPDNELVLKNLADGYLRDQHISRISAGMRYHHHITGGSGGILFEYRQEPDGTVTPYVIDVANKRHDNKYDWKKGPKGPPY